MKNKLIEVAKEARMKRKSEYSKEEIELALAWANDEVSLGGVEKATKKKGYSFVASALRQYIRNLK